ncbi:MAG: hypothetical protein IPN20_20165 [Haliscomenobacter sp.]|nr:hypothetical protein [Haliscomenobacter sp.]
MAAAEELSQALQRRKALYQEELALAAAEYERSRKLHLQHVISDQELEAQKTKWLQARRYAQSMEEEAIQNRIRSGQLRTQQANLMAERQMGMEERTRSLQQATLQVKGAIDQWRHQYVLTAPIDGMLSWKTGVSEGQYLPGGASPGTIIPCPRARPGCHLRHSGCLARGGSGRAIRCWSIWTRFLPKNLAAWKAK